MDHHAVLGLLRKWRSPTEVRRTRLLKGSRNLRRTTALAHALDWLEDEELHHLHAVGVAAWAQQEYGRWPEERSAPRLRTDAPVCLCQSHCGSPSPFPAHPLVGSLGVHLPCPQRLHSGTRTVQTQCAMTAPLRSWEIDDRTWRCRVRYHLIQAALWPHCQSENACLGP